MMELTKEESISYTGGAVSASLLSAVSNLMKTIYNMGQNLGGTIKRWINGTTC